MNTIESWTIWDPSWVSIGVHSFEYEDEGKTKVAYQAFLNFCLSEGEPETQDDVKFITIATSVFGDNPGYVAVKAVTMAE